MPIPEVDVFNDFLSSLTLSKPRAAKGYDRLVVIPKKNFKDSSRVFTTDHKWLWYSTECGITPESLFERIQKELRRNGHVASTDVVPVLLAILYLSPLSHKPSSTGFMHITLLYSLGRDNNGMIKLVNDHP